MIFVNKSRAFSVLALARTGHQWKQESILANKSNKVIRQVGGFKCSGYHSDLMMNRKIKFQGSIKILKHQEDITMLANDYNVHMVN